MVLVLVIVAALALLTTVGLARCFSLRSISSSNRGPSIAGSGNVFRSAWTEGSQMLSFAFV